MVVFGICIFKRFALKNKKAKKTKGVKRKGPADAVLLKAEKVARQSGLKGGVLAATIARRAKEREWLAPKPS